LTWFSCCFNCIIKMCSHCSGVTTRTMTPFCPMFWVLKKNECSKMLHNERGICIFNLSTNKYYNEWFKSIEQIFNVMSKYKPKRNVNYTTFPKWHTFIWSGKTLLKTSNNVIFLHSCLLYFFPNLWKVFF